MELIKSFLGILLLAYMAIICFLLYGFSKIPYFISNKKSPENAFSILVPFRNEVQNLPDLLDSFSTLHFPNSNFELIFIDDFSTDNSSKIIENWHKENSSIQLKLITNNQKSLSPKKEALSKAIGIAKYEWIITTDADCCVPMNWLKTLDQFIQTHDAAMVIGAVKLRESSNVFVHFQKLEILSLQGTTIGTFGCKLPFMCNGANFAYTKKLFAELHGYVNNNNIGSGDDVFLLQKAVRICPEKVFYLKNSDFVVETKAEKTLYNLIQQRIRWASKTSKYEQAFGKLVAIIVLLTNGVLAVLLLLFCFNIVNRWFLLLYFGSKYVLDYLLIQKTNVFLYGKSFVLVLLSSLLYPFYSSLIGTYSLFGSYKWKQRDFK